ncbi:MAG: N-acyl-D-amino-acid deacylase [Thermoanaerobaculia bacterium]|jgi:dihydroorotase/N-acyl-D-amino-acid deacylase|nr:N-acyl-D-amino-acid deacylase [Thermoanaerobaculia bacterium]
MKVASGQWSVVRNALVGVLALFTASCATQPKPTSLDLKIINGRIIDGTGAPWYRGDVGVRGDTIVSIGDLSHVFAATTIDAHDNVVSPGFIDLLGQSQGSVFEDGHLEAKVRQGVTTEVTGEGHSPGPLTQKQIDDANPQNRPKWHTLGEWFTALEKHGTAINFALFVGADNPREMVIGTVNRPPTADEMREMERIVDQAMREGAIGLSTSLIYLPAMFSTTDEIINLAKVAAQYGGVYFSHIRDEGDHIDTALDEAFRIGREAKIPVNIWHLKVGGRPNWGRMPHVIERINAARLEGLDVSANVYPYAASSTSLSTLVPDWSLEGGYTELKKRLADPEQRTRIAAALQAQFAKRGPHGIYITRIGNPALAQYEKHFVDDIATMMNVAPDEAMIRLFAETNGSPGVIFFSMNEEDVQTALKQPFVSIGSDSGAPPPAARAGGFGAHPRAYGTFPRVMGHYVRDEHLFTLEEAVRKATSQAADRTNIHDRGILRPGMKADIVVFDAATIKDVSTYEDPHHFSEGILDVIVNGTPVLRDGAMTNALPGKVLRGRGYVR